MIHKEKYFDLLFKCLHDNDLLPIKEQDEWRYDLQQYFEKTCIDGTIIDKMKNQYGIGLQNVFLINCKKYALICDNFRIARNKILIQTAVYFTVLGCLLDYLLDHGNRKQQAEARKKTDWDYCKCYFLKKTNAQDNSVIDILYEKISLGMNEIFLYSRERYAYILQLIKMAINSERSVNCVTSYLIQKNVVLNKSIIFVKIPSEILLCNKETIKDIDRKLIEELGYVFALIDDLCDLYEDIEIGQMNLLMENMREFETEAGAKKIMAFIVCELRKKIQNLKKNFDGKLFEFLLYEIKDWSISNAELQKRIWCYHNDPII